MKNNEMMKMMENGETVIGMLHHVIIRLRYRSCKCTPSWTRDDEEEYTEVTEKYRRRRRMKRSSPNRHPWSVTSKFSTSPVQLLGPQDANR